MPVILHRTAFTSGQGESMLAESIKDYEAALPSHIKLAYLPAFGMVRLRLTSTGNNKEQMEKEINALFETLKTRVKEYLVTDEDDSMQVVIGKILKQKGKTMGTAESCTGGYIAHLITSIPGSSNYYNGSIVSYANDIKHRILNVSNDTLKANGAVSEETVVEMAKGALEELKVDFVIATSGIMGPDGGSEQKPVGTVWLAAASRDKVITKQLNLRFDRERNIRQTAHMALDFLRKFILTNS